MELRANRSGCQAKIPPASPAQIRSSISAKTFRPGSLAVCASLSEATISSFSLAANSFNSESCDSSDITCRSSLSVDFLV
ncbi:MAG: hypothetical protein A3F21_00340 [Candidatus Portnoybacteria bacterium RIFCSPLOWO2_01_FULL_38_39]|nr:MAG: hypothetical protein A3F21_00340 [Candidatus Portnoybacteria bacterium RIFCSPLOWO2_01_FULL_38_39]